LLVGGNPEEMTEHEAMEQALNHLAEMKQSQPAETTDDNDPVPFSTIPEKPKTLRTEYIRDAATGLVTGKVETWE